MSKQEGSGDFSLRDSMLIYNHPHIKDLWPLHHLGRHSWPRDHISRSNMKHHPYSIPRESIYDIRGFAPPRASSTRSSHDQEQLSRGLLFGDVGLHCYNVQKGTNLQYVDRDKFFDYDGLFTGYVALKVKDLIQDSSTCLLETSFYCERHRDHWSVITTLCRLKPPTPPPQEVRDYYTPPFRKHPVDDLFGGYLPDWIPDITSDKVQYYEMKESEVEEAKEWLHLYAELALYSMCESMREVKWRMSYVLGKTIVQTRADAKNPVEAEKSKPSHGDVFRAIVRRTTDGMPGHMSLKSTV